MPGSPPLDRSRPTALRPAPPPGICSGACRAVQSAPRERATFDARARAPRGRVRKSRAAPREKYSSHFAAARAALCRVARTAGGKSGRGHMHARALDGGFVHGGSLAFLHAAARSHTRLDRTQRAWCVCRSSPFSHTHLPASSPHPNTPRGARTALADVRWHICTSFHDARWVH